jgi:hypothetical protein
VLGVAAQASEHPYTYASTQATNCAGCGKYKHTPLRIDAMGGYVCLTCIDQKLGALLGEFGYQAPQEPLTDRQISALIFHEVYDGDASIPHRDGWANDIGIPFARAIERAHGIKAPNVRANLDPTA